MRANKRQIIVMGGGAWGAALAMALSLNDEIITRCLVRDEATANALSKGTVPRLAHMPLSTPIRATCDDTCLADADAIYLVLPAAATVEALALITRISKAECPVILCAKGLIDTPDHSSLFLPEFMAHYAISRPFALLSGPSFADEVIKGLPAALVCASDSQPLSEQVVADFLPSHLRLYSGDDPIGVAVGGAVKNVIALAAGICAGLGLGDNAKAALLTRGLAETGRLISALGGNPMSLTGLAGIGDLSLTAAGPHSRNMAYGLALGAGDPLPSALAEGARTAPMLAQRARELQIEMPITQAVAKALTGADLPQLITDLLARKAVRE